jgi:uncharacterized protein involved in exopolysaccharide biosynthesis
MTAVRELLAPEMDTRSERASSPLAEFGPEALEAVGIDRPGIDRPVVDRPEIDRPYLATKLVWEQRRFIANFVARGTLLSLLIALLLPSSYESKAELMPPDSQSSAMGTLAALTAGSGGAGGVLSSAADLLGVRTSGALFINILSSHTVEDRLINRFDLRRVYRTRTYAKARKQLESLTTVSEEKKSGVLTIVVSDRDPKRAAAMVQAYVEELNHMVADLNTSAAHRERVFLEERLQVVKQELDRSAKEFSDFSSKNAAIDIKEQGRSMVAAAATVQGQIIAAESELRGLEQIYNVNNVRVRSVQARMAELQQQLQKLGGSASVPESAADSYPSLRQLPVLGLTYADLYRRLTINESVYEALTKEYEMARVQEAKEIPSVKIIDPAELAEGRAGPSRTLITVAGALLSLCVAGVWLFSAEAWANTDDRNPRKILAGEILTAAGKTARWSRARELSGQLTLFGFRRHFHTNHKIHSEPGTE